MNNQDKNTGRNPGPSGHKSARHRRGSSGKPVHAARAGQTGQHHPRREAGGATGGGAGSRRRTHGGGSRKPTPHGKLLYAKTSTKKEDIIPDIGDSIRIIPLGGVEEIGRNMTVIEYKNDIVVVDMGFQFKEPDTPGIDYILPNTKYLEDRKHKVRAVVITHGHLDHIGGIPYILGRIGNPPIYSRNLTTLLIKKRQEEFPHVPKPDVRIVEKDDTIRISDTMSLKFFAVTHTIPDAMGIIIQTPHGSIVHTGDLKLDHVNGVPTEKEVDEFKKFEKENVLLLMADSTNVERPGFSIPEDMVNKNIDEIIKNTSGRIIIGTFASQLERIMKIIESAETYGRKVVVEGRSMKTNVEIAKEAGILKAKDGTLLTIEEMHAYDPNKILILATGAQGDEFATLMRTANKTHKQLKITPKDTIILSSSIVPGNERSVQKLKDNLSRQGAHIIHYQVSDVHSSGHANHGETLWIHKKIKPKFFIPIHGYHYMLRVHADIAKEAGMPEQNVIIPDNSMVIEIIENGTRMVKLAESAPSSIVLVDGFSVGDIQDVVLRDRQMLAQDGIFVVIATVDINTGKLRKSPDIISRGFVYLRESQELLHDARHIVKKTIEDSLVGMHPINLEYVKDKVSDDIARFLLQKTAKRPIVIPVLLGV
ncbi:MAG: ribonuclease J [Patescibacteria group bacterium]